MSSNEDDLKNESANETANDADGAGASAIVTGGLSHGAPTGILVGGQDAGVTGALTDTPEAAGGENAAIPSAPMATGGEKDTPDAPDTPEAAGGENAAGTGRHVRPGL